MTLTVAVRGVTAQSVDTTVAELVSSHVASRIAQSDSTLWGKAAQPEASIRLGWFSAPQKSRELVEPIEALRSEFAARGLTRLVLCGMGGSSLAPEMITRTAGVDLVVLDATHPTQVSRALDTDIDSTVVVIASKSGSTTETDSHKRTFEAAFIAAGIDPVSRIVIVTDPGSPLDVGSREVGYRVFNADPTVGGRYSALTAFGLVPSGLAGVDITTLLDEAENAMSDLAADVPTNPALILGAAMAARAPEVNKMLLWTSGSSIAGIGEWIEQLVAESTGKDGRGVLPLVAGHGYPNLDLNDVVEVTITDTVTTETYGDVVVSGPLGAQILLWECATAVASRILGVNPFDQPDVESAKIASRTFLEREPETPADFQRDDDIEFAMSGFTSSSSTVQGVVDDLLALVNSDGYVAIHAYADRAGTIDADEIQRAVVRRTRRPTSLGWGPRFLHSTGQFHKGGPAQGFFIQIVDQSPTDREIPGRPFTFGTLMSAQADGDAAVLSGKGRPVLTLRALTEGGLTSISQNLSSDS